MTQEKIVQPVKHGYICFHQDVERCQAVFVTCGTEGGLSILVKDPG